MRVTFSQSNLQDYTACARRFELRYLQNLQWPAIETEPVLEQERHLQRGSQLHRMIHQHIIGIPAESIAATVTDDPQLQTWWSNYLSRSPIADPHLPVRRFPEVTLNTSLAGYRLTAKFDLLAIDPGKRARIVDWKTSNRKPSRKTLAARWQTRVYRYVLAEAGAELNDGAPLQPDQIEMVYWFANTPDATENFAYDSDQYKADKTALSDIIREIEARDVYELTADERKCKFCRYRSLCNRGIEAGQDDEMLEDSTDIDADSFDFDQIAEIEF